MLFKLVLVPAENVRTCSPKGTLPEYVTVSEGPLYEVIADIEDRQISMSRGIYDTIKVIEVPALPAGGV